MSSNNSSITKGSISYADMMPLMLDKLNKGYSITLKLRGISMRPFLEDGRDRGVLTKPTTFKGGDVVFALLPQGYYVLHRIIKIDGENLTLRGDGNFACEYCTKSDVKATAVAFYRKGRNTLDKTTDLKWKVYSFLWMRLFFMRRILLFLYRKLCLKQSQ